MGAYPTTPRSAFLEWCQAHAPVFTANATNIGLTAAQATAFANATTALAAAMLAQEQAKQAALVATQVAGDAFSTLRSSAGDSVRSIRAFAEQQAKPSLVYNLAQIPPPAAPTPMPPPGQPTDLTVTLTPADGRLTLRWKSNNPPGAAGTSYIVRRRLPGAGEFAFIGVSGKKEFVDSTLIAGPDSVQYTVQGQRSDLSGPVSEIFTVNFGQQPDGMMMATVANAANALAAMVREGIHAPAMAGMAGMAGMAAGMPTASTVNGQPVDKYVPSVNRCHKRPESKRHRSE